MCRTSPPLRRLSRTTPVVNGTAYPICRVGRKAYRFRILNACNDRFLNLGLYFARSNRPDTVDPTTGLPTLQTPLRRDLHGPPPIPRWWCLLTGRRRMAGRVESPTRIAWARPMIQIGTEGGFLPAPR